MVLPLNIIYLHMIFDILIYLYCLHLLFATVTCQIISWKLPSSPLWKTNSDTCDKNNYRPIALVWQPQRFFLDLPPWDIRNVTFLHMITNLVSKVNIRLTCAYLQWKVLLNIKQNKILLCSLTFSMSLKLLTESITVYKIHYSIIICLGSETTDVR